MPRDNPSLFSKLTTIVGRVGKLRKHSDGVKSGSDPCLNSLPTQSLSFPERELSRKSTHRRETSSDIPVQSSSVSPSNFSFPNGSMPRIPNGGRSTASILGYVPWAL